jgi:uncharacterized protein (TIGR04222 family)
VNPFDLTGPSFLIFYWTLSVSAALLVYWLRLRTDADGGAAKMVSDPYALAYLRDGYPEVMRVALVTLVEEGVVTVEYRDFSLVPKGPPARRGSKRKRPAVEQEVIAFLTSRSSTIDLIVDASVGHDACEGYRLELEELGYLRRRASTAGLSTISGFVVAFLLAVAAIKVFIAFSRGRSNVLFLVMSAAAAAWVAYRLGHVSPSITTRGKRALEAAEALLAGARQRLKDASGALRAQELAWLAAAFGFSVFDYTPTDFAFWPALAFAPEARARKIFQPNSESSSSWHSCSTTTSSCSGGSSCGGGCGGGCGGCGS